ncbi:MAG: MoxR family ATPase [Planctomycetaceae bacterium]
MPVTEPGQDLSELHDRLQKLRNTLGRVIRGKDDAIRLILTAIAAGGSILMEDVPGVGKTTLAKALAKLSGAEFGRVQFTPDLLPNDILGSSIYNPRDGTFRFQQGPVFCSVLLADEINRASPRTQSALLEAMSEGQATIEGVRHDLPKPFIVLATQNPVDFHGTYPLPEAQLDRFLMRVSLGYPEKEMEVAMLFDQAVALPIDDLTPILNQADILSIQKHVREITVEQSVAEYMIEIVNSTRYHNMLKLGVSPRGSLMLFRAAQSAAMLDQRSYVLPDDVQLVAAPVLAHRVVRTSKARYSGIMCSDLIREIVESLPVPA